MSAIPQLRMLSLAGNGLKAIDNVNFFHRKGFGVPLSELWYLDLSGNQLETLGEVETWLPPSVTSLHLEGNRILSLPAAFELVTPKALARLNSLAELWIDVTKGGNRSAVLCNAWNPLKNVTERLAPKKNSATFTSPTTTTQKREPKPKLPTSAKPVETSSTTKSSKYV